MFSSAIFIRSSIDVGYMTKATPPVLSAISASSAALWLPPTKEILWSVRGSSIPRTGLRTFPEDGYIQLSDHVLLLIDIRPCFQVIPLSVHIHSHTMLLYRLAWKSRHQHQFKVELQGRPEMPLQSGRSNLLQSCYKEECRAGHREIQQTGNN